MIATLRQPEAANERAPVQGVAPRASCCASEVALLTGGEDKPYALGLASALVSQGIFLDFIGSDELDGPQLHETDQVNFLNLQGSQRRDASFARKAFRVLRFYRRLLYYALTAKPRIFHVLWNNKFEFFDRTILMLYYKVLGRKIVLTAHNINAGKRDSNDSFLNRFTLKMQYRLSDHIFVHTGRMKGELERTFDLPGGKISVIPFGINNTLPSTSLTSAQARKELGLDAQHKVMLFFGNIAPYKGVEYLATAFSRLAREDANYRLIIAGPTKNAEYWTPIHELIRREKVDGQTVQRIAYIPDEQVERYFKAADVLILPYTEIFQSGVLFLGYSFGLPVIATDVGSLREEIVEGKTGLVCQPRDPDDLAEKIRTYFRSALFKELSGQRQMIREYANERYSWTKVGQITKAVYSRLVAG